MYYNIVNVTLENVETVARNSSSIEIKKSFELSIILSNKTFNNPISLSRSRPVVRVSATVELEAFDGKIDPENRTCSLLSGTKVACLSLQGCLLYEGEAVTEELGNN